MAEPTSSSSVEVEAIKAHAAMDAAAVTHLIAENVRLQAQVAELREQFGQYVHGAETEVSRLRADLARRGQQVADVQRDLEHVSAERARLRADLEHTRQIVGAVKAVRQLVDRQAEDEGLWFIAPMASEAYLQQELRALHAAVEAIPLARLDAADVPAAREGR